MGVVERTTMLIVPLGTRGVTIACGLLNFILPGFGTVICGAVTHNLSDMIIGSLQFVSFVLIIGWIWSVVWGFLMIKRSCQKTERDPNECYV
ncbi:MAG: hypothetical protein KVP17_004714 [Porospora cf. gigantea B]|uniref:uncharacterized protein n=1 Tax=Porospora cf. gigantea B TaxID=2853592 RepID=UPI003571BD69|nr:MAG: hypothetical protein KVP17_004714 [Porospora cf. gigantea B]